MQLSGEVKDTSDHICALHYTDEGARSPHRGFPMRVGQDVVDLDLALVQGAQIHPQLIGPVVCWTKTLPSVVPLGVLLREKVKFSKQIFSSWYILFSPTSHSKAFNECFVPFLQYTTSLTVAMMVNHSKSGSNYISLSLNIQAEKTMISDICYS